MTTQRELRFLKSGTELRASADGRKLTGIAAPFNAPAEVQQPGSGFTEVIRPGAFRNCLRDDVVLCLNHDRRGALLARTPNTLRLEERQAGLWFEADANQTALWHDVLENVRVGNLRGCSFGFRCGADNWKNGIREILRVEKLTDVSVVVDPTYSQTTVAIRSQTDRQYEYRSIGIYSISEPDDAELELMRARLRFAQLL